MEHVQECECEWEYEVVVKGWSRRIEVASWSIGLGWCASVSGSWVGLRGRLLYYYRSRCSEESTSLAHGADSRSSEKLGCD
jgi:hypothetical protein